MFAQSQLTLHLSSIQGVLRNTSCSISVQVYISVRVCTLWHFLLDFSVSLKSIVFLFCETNLCKCKDYQCDCFFLISLFSYALVCSSSLQNSTTDLIIPVRELEDFTELSCCFIFIFHLSVPWRSYQWCYYWQKYGLGECNCCLQKALLSASQRWGWLWSLTWSKQPVLLRTVRGCVPFRFVVCGAVSSLIDQPLILRWIIDLMAFLGAIKEWLQFVQLNIKPCNFLFNYACLYCVKDNFSY